ncbi:MAG TPA: TIGR01459 family HAD-type hydrolase [Xanthobacteraceae bacterium]|jgi:HAD superfamily hydrolase (TIGR01459 family)|nr:TIGR01459 family HAD-type hydrolase [Xanthobacteraceae bacterium]
MTSAPTVLTDHFNSIASRYDVVLSDVWGVVHNGVEATASAADALTRFRQQGGFVMLISNAPRPGEWVLHHLDKLGVPRTAYDGIITSGDVTREFIASRPDVSAHHVGPQRDRNIFDGLNFRFAPVESAEYVVCTGLFDDETETPEHYRDLIGAMRKRDLLMVCANPDLVVERGEKLVYCAGAIADLYATEGGKVLYAGKPHRKIYEDALAKIEAARGRAAPLDRVLAIGDSVRTDLKGATSAGIDCLFVTGGIHAEELGHRDDPDLGVLEEILVKAGLKPRAITRRLAW